MATRSRALLSLLILTGTTTASVVACGGDDDSGGGTTTVDAGKDSAIADAASDAPTTAQAVAAPVTVYYGAAVKLDATPSTGPSGFTYTWAFSSVPAGSTVTAAILTDPTTAMPGFQPDRIGTYTLVLTVAGGGSTSSIPVLVTVVDPPVFYARADSDGGPLSSATMNVVGAVLGDGGTPVSCFTRDSGSLSGDVVVVGTTGGDWWEAPAGQPSKLVYEIDTRADGGAHATLLASTSSSTCASAPVVLDELGNSSANSGGSRQLEQPKLSPSGARVAYLRTVADGTTISTVGFDGAARRDLAPFYAFPDGGAQPDASTPSGTTNSAARPTWIDETTLAWVQSTGTSWQVVSIADATGAQPKLVMTCAGTAPKQLGFLSSGEVLVAGATPTSGGSTMLTAYTPDPTTKACGAPRDLSKLPVGTGFMQDFALSPDRTMLAFLDKPDSGLPLEMRVIKTDGTVLSATPTVYASTTSGGPRWVGGGTLLSWPAAQATFDASVTSASAVIAVSQPDGGGLHQVTSATSGNSYVAAIGNGFCAMGRGYGSGVTFFGILGVAGLRLARRRKNAKR